jgi:hypothetical protein
MENNHVAVTIIAMRCRACGVTKQTPDFFVGENFWREHNLHGPILFIREISEELDSTSQESLDEQMGAMYRRLK